MPIRTDRGRGAALRSFWSWPLRSGGHLIVTAAAAATVITGVAVLANATTGGGGTGSDSTAIVTESGTVVPSTARRSPSRSSSPGPASSSASSAAPSPSATTASSSSDAEQAASPGAASAGQDGAATTATRFMRRWVRPEAGTTAHQWEARLHPLVLPESRAKLDSVAPETIPARRVTGAPTVEPRGEAVMTAEVPTDAGAIRVEMLAYQGHWLVRTWEPVR